MCHVKMKGSPLISQPGARIVIGIAQIIRPLVQQCVVCVGRISFIKIKMRTMCGFVKELGSYQFRRSAGMIVALIE